MNPKSRPCGCSPYLQAHRPQCSDTPIFAELTEEYGENPFDTWPYLVLALIRT